MRIEDRTPQLAALHARIFGTTAADAPPRGTGRGTENLPPLASVAHLSDDELLARATAAANGEKFARLWAGDVGEYDSHSEADLALCCTLGFWTQRDPERIDRLFRRSGLYRAKWDRDNYRERTITRAIAITDEVYAPPPMIVCDPAEVAL